MRTMSLLDFVPRTNSTVLSEWKDMEELRQQQPTKQCKRITTNLAFEQHFPSPLYQREHNY